MLIMDKLRNLLVMAASDGHLTEREIRYFTDRSQKWGIPDDQLADAIRYALSADASLAIPPGASDRREMLSDLIAIMAADAELAPIERDLFAVVAARMGIAEGELNMLIDRAIRKKTT